MLCITLTPAPHIAYVIRIHVFALHFLNYLLALLKYLKYLLTYFIIVICCRFPKNMQLQKQWVHNIGRKAWQPTSCSFLCSAHFEERYFDRTGHIVHLRDDAIPTIFNFLGHLQPKPVQQRASRTSCTTEMPVGMFVSTIRW